MKHLLKARHAGYYKAIDFEMKPKVTWSGMTQMCKQQALLGCPLSQWSAVPSVLLLVTEPRRHRGYAPPSPSVTVSSVQAALMQAGVIC